MFPDPQAVVYFVGVQHKEKDRLGWVWQERLPMFGGALLVCGGFPGSSFQRGVFRLLLPCEGLSAVGGWQCPPPSLPVTAAGSCCPARSVLRGKAGPRLCPVRLQGAPARLSGERGAAELRVAAGPREELLSRRGHGRRRRARGKGRPAVRLPGFGSGTFAGRGGWGTHLRSSAVLGLRAWRGPWRGRRRWRCRESRRGRGLGGLGGPGARRPPPPPPACLGAPSCFPSDGLGR